MARSPTTASLRAEASARAQRRCEYCQRSDDQKLSAYAHEVDHVIAKKHGGETVLANLAYACFDCNRHKGTDLSSIDPHTGKVTLLFNPRTQRWRDHFRLQADGIILARTAAGRATARLLSFNDPLLVQIRADLIAAGELNVRRKQS
jgi:hypothetical protein